MLYAPLLVETPQGRRVQLRRVHAHDKERLQEGLKHFSPRSTYQRFFSPVVHLSDKELRYLTEVDGVNHVAIAALAADAEGQPGLGVARYIRLKDDPGTAEPAVAVADAHQGQGIGTLLLVALSLVAGANGISTFEAYLVDENRAFMHHLKGLGAEDRRSRSGLVELRFPVYTDPGALPDTQAGRKHREAFRALFAAARE